VEFNINSMLLLEGSGNFNRINPC